jgi:aminoglycoside phosphotransferase (APT) family kinase protein
MLNTSKVQIDTTLVQKLIASQFPQWANLPIKRVEHGGWDNRTFHLGEHMSIRLPSAACYAEKVKKEQYWLLKLAPHLPLPIPKPLAMGQPSNEYPWHWSIYQWIDGETASIERIDDLSQFAADLANFLIALQQIDTTGGLEAGPHNFYRGGPLKTYDAETCQAIAALGNNIDTATVTAIWEEALASSWHRPSVWVHGDVAVGNLLVNNGKLAAVIDFGGLGIGDPACDLVLAWTLFKGESREAFRTTLQLDAATWARARGWALWKALIVCAELPGTNPLFVEHSWLIIDEILHEYQKS